MQNIQMIGEYENWDLRNALNNNLNLTFTMVYQKWFETWTSNLSCGNKLGALINYFLKTFDTIDHDLFFSKLKAYGFNENTVSFTGSYLTKRYQRTKFGSTSCGWDKIITGVPQCLILGLLSFNNFINDLFLFTKKCEICNYNDDNTLYSANKNINQTITDRSNDFQTLTKWCYDNYMVLNPDKFHFMTLGLQDKNFNFHYENIVIRSSAEEKILGITIRNKLNFKSHIINISTVANQKLSALCKILNYIDSVMVFLKTCNMFWQFRVHKFKNLV